MILTYGVSRTIEFFMKAAAGRRTKRKARAFEVLVCESAPQFTGQEMAKSLAAAGIATTVIADTAIFAVMPRVTKASAEWTTWRSRHHRVVAAVATSPGAPLIARLHPAPRRLPPQVLISAHAIMANGGVIAPNGCHMLALAAKHHAIPMICVSGLHKVRKGVFAGPGGERLACGITQLRAAHDRPDSAPAFPSLPLRAGHGERHPVSVGGAAL